MSRAKKVFDKLCRVLNLDTQAAAAELNRRYGTKDPEKLSEKQINELFLDLRKGAFAMASKSKNLDDLDDDLDPDEFDPAALVPAETGPRKIDVEAIYKKWNSKKAGVKIFDHSPDAGGDDEDD